MKNYFLEQALFENPLTKKGLEFTPSGTRVIVNGPKEQDRLAAIETLISNPNEYFRTSEHDAWAHGGIGSLLVISFSHVE